MKIKLLFEEGVETLIELTDSLCARAIYEALPFESRVNLWGEEIYFSTPLSCELDETAQEVVSKGDVGFWPTGKALCLFFGPTPISEPGEIRPASAVNVVGKIISSLEDLYQIKESSLVKVEKA